MPKERVKINRNIEDNQPGIRINGEPDCKIILVNYTNHYIQICYKNQLGFEKRTVVTDDDEETIEYIKKYCDKRSPAGRTVTLNELLEYLTKK